MIFIFTSNCPPERLYEGGLNRSRFAPFIETLRSTCQPILLDSHRDFRGLVKKKHRLSSPSYSTPPRDLSEVINYLIDANEYFSSATKRNIAVDVFHGRQLPLLLLDETSGSGLVDFKSLCQSPTAPADFVGLACIVNRHLFIANVPQLDVRQDAEACRRFIRLDDHEKDICTSHLHTLRQSETYSHVESRTVHSHTSNWSYLPASLTDVFYENGVKMCYEAQVAPMRLIKGVSAVVEVRTFHSESRQRCRHTTNS